MAKYFSKFPLTYYSLGNGSSLDIVTNITSRFAIENNIKDNIVLYQNYNIQDSDTPEIIADKLYDSPEKHWIVLLVNDILDVESEWPMSYENLMKYVDEKYMPENGLQYDGINWAKANIHSYWMVRTETFDKNYVTVNKYQIDANSYTSLVESINDQIALGDSNVINVNLEKEIKSYYDYELEVNENKRKIRLLRPEFATTLEQQLKEVFDSKTT